MAFMTLRFRVYSLLAIFCGLWVWLVWPSFSKDREAWIHARIRPTDAVAEEFKKAYLAGKTIPASHDDMAAWLESRPSTSDPFRRELFRTFREQGIYLHNFTDREHKRYEVALFFGIASNHNSVAMISEEDGWNVCTYGELETREKFGEVVVRALRWSDTHYPELAPYPATQPYPMTQKTSS
jgi:hypothetical protein